MSIDDIQMKDTYHWKRQTMAETFQRILQTPTQPWVAIGDFLDDWRFSAHAYRRSREKSNSTCWFSA